MSVLTGLHYWLIKISRPCRFIFVIFLSKSHQLSYAFSLSIAPYILNANYATEYYSCKKLLQYVFYCGRFHMLKQSSK